VLVAIISFVMGVTINNVTNPAIGATAIYADSAEWGSSATLGAGGGLTFDGNTVCFVDAAASCDNNIDWNGTDMIISAS